MTTPSYPQLTVGQTSDDLQIYAKPDNILEIRPSVENNALIFKPSRIVIYPSTMEASFTITASRPGIFTIKYEIIGLNAYNFEHPKEDKVYAYNKMAALKSVDVSINFYEGKFYAYFLLTDCH